MADETIWSRMRFIAESPEHPFARQTLLEAATHIELLHNLRDQDAERIAAVERELSEARALLELDELYISRDVRSIYETAKADLLTRIRGGPQ